MSGYLLEKAVKITQKYPQRPLTWGTDSMLQLITWVIFWSEKHRKWKKDCYQKKYIKQFINCLITLKHDNAYLFSIRYFQEIGKTVSTGHSHIVNYVA